MHPLLSGTDWRAEGDATVALLRDLLRFDTSNPPGDEDECAGFVAEQLRGSGLQPEVLTAAPRRASVVARLRGAGDEAPLLLNAHLDVVPVEAGRWSRPPFAGEVADGWVWGRGAIDMKHMAAMSLRVLDLLARSGAPLRRDVLFAGVADEEAGQAHGSAWLVDEHPEKVRAGCALGEVGGFPVYLGGTPVYLVQVAEKGTCLLCARTEGPTGHGSVPRPDNALVTLGAFLSRVGSLRLPAHVSPPTARFVRELAAIRGPPAGRLLELLVDQRWSRLADQRWSRLAPRWPLRTTNARLLDAILRNTVSPTRVAGGYRSNVIPGRAEALLDGRVAIGSSASELVAELGKLASPDVALEVLGTRAPHASSPDTPLFETIRSVVAEHHPGAVAVPSVIPGTTDALHWAKLGATCYGFSPVRLEPDQIDFADLFHAHDERVPVAGLHAGLRMLADVVFRFCVAQS